MSRRDQLPFLTGAIHGHGPNPEAYGIDPEDWQPTPVAAIHGPQGDCPECWARNDWCPESLGGASYGPDVSLGNPEPAQASVPTSGQGSVPASTALTGIQPCACQDGGSIRCPGCEYGTEAAPAAPEGWTGKPISSSTAPSTPVDLCPAHPGTEPNFYGRCPFDHNPDGSCWHNSKNGVHCEYCGETIGQPSTPVHNPVDNPATSVVTATGVPMLATALPGTVIDSSRPSLAAFMSAAKHVAQSGNTPWAAQYANELRQIVIDRANNAPRNLQQHLGPSEIGTPCDRQVVGKLVGFPKTNHVTDSWPSLMGTAGHAWMEECFTGHNTIEGWERWLVEYRVTPHPDHPGTSDLYDRKNFCVDDHKFLGETQMAKLRSNNVPDKYFYQLLTYRRGYQLLGLRVDRIVIIGWPRTGSSVDGMYVWEHPCTPEDDQKLDTLFARMEWRKQWAAAITAGNARFSDVPAVPDDDECYFCDFYRPQSARDGGPGCPGHVGT